MKNLKSLTQSKNQKSEFRQTDRRRSFYAGLIISIILVLSPAIFYLHTFIPEKEVWKTKYFTLHSGGFGYVHVFIYHLIAKLTLVFGTTLWFFTNRNWWRYALLVPLVVFLYQLVGVINVSSETISELDFFKALPITLPIIILLIIASRRLNFLTQAMDLKDEISSQITNIKRKKHEPENN
ncbi:MAG: hypothetical protein ACWA5P_02055 [bacterium]